MRIYPTDKPDTYWYFPSAWSVPPWLPGSLLHCHHLSILPDPLSSWSFATSSTAYSLIVLALCSLNSQDSLFLPLLWNLQVFLLQHGTRITKKKNLHSMKSHAKRNRAMRAQIRSRRLQSVATSNQSTSRSNHWYLRRWRGPPRQPVCLEVASGYEKVTYKQRLFGGEMLQMEMGYLNHWGCW